MNRIPYFGLVLVTLLANTKSSAAENWVPQKPTKLVVYMAPGGLIDVTARKFTEIAAKYTDHNFVVENKPGAGGILAVKHVLNQPSDGYTLFACTKSNIAKIVASDGQGYLAKFHWLALMMRDPECVITRSDSELSSWQSLVEDGRRKNGQQTWVGPDTGGLDHVMALKTWAEAGFTAKWIPFKSGGSAKAALLGKQGVAYVGNPGDALGNPDLKIVALSARHRIPQLPNVPTFDELGLTGLGQEFMWRGFAMREGCPPEAIQWYSDLIEKVTNDPNWRAFWEKSGIEVVHLTHDEFKPIVESDRAEFQQYLTQIGIIANVRDDFWAKLTLDDRHLKWFGLSTILAIAVAVGLSRRSLHSMGEWLIPLLLCLVACLAWLETFAFPQNDQAGPELIPRLFAGVILCVGCGMLVSRIRQLTSHQQTALGSKQRADMTAAQVPTHSIENVSAVVAIGVGVTFYLLGTYWIGYYAATAIFMVGSMSVLGLNNIKLSLGVAAGWLAISYVVFAKLLFVPLPIGKLWEPFL